MAIRLPIGRMAAVASLLVALFLIARGTTSVHFRTLAPGVEIAMIRGEPFCQQGPSEIAVLRLDPQHVGFHVKHYSHETYDSPPNILEWQRRTAALAVFNAGQYYPDWSYMGLLVGDGETISKDMHPDFKAAFVASPERGGRAAHVLDLSASSLDPAHPGWREVAQSFMLFDHHGTIRV